MSVTIQNPTNAQVALLAAAETVNGDNFAAWRYVIEYAEQYLEWLDKQA